MRGDWRVAVYDTEGNLDAEYWRPTKEDAERLAKNLAMPESLSVESGFKVIVQHVIDVSVRTKS